MLTVVALVVLAVAITAYVLGRRKAVAAAGGQLAALHSRPSYHGLYALLVTLIPALVAMVALNTGYDMWRDAQLHALARAARPDLPPIQIDLIVRDAGAIARGLLPSADDDVRRTLAGAYATFDFWRQALVAAVALGLAAAGALYAYGRIDRGFRARNLSEAIIRGLLMVCAGIAILTTLGIVLSLLGETFRFVNRIGWRVDSFLFGTVWSPLSGVFAGQLDPTKVGAVALFLGTLLITLIAMLVSLPIGLFAAIYLSEFASPAVRAGAKPVLEILAGIPTVVYGFFAAITVAPFIRNTGEALGLSVASESALAAGVVMGIMIIPFISSLSDDVINAVPQSLRDGSYGLGATKAETIRRVVLPAALPGIVSAFLLGFSKAVGETMIVVMAAGQGANLTFNPLQAVTTVTVQIVALITGDTEADTAGPPAFALGFTLFLITLGLNVAALRIVRRYREVYE
jgi:phosphate transport system permease protein